MIKTRKATLVGSGALILWALEPLTVAELSDFPLFESLTLIFTICFTLTAIRITINKTWGNILSQPLFVWCFGIVAICGGDFAYMLSAYTAPVAHVDLIEYIWPIMLVAIIGFIPGGEKFEFKNLLGGLLGLFSVIYMLTGGEDLSGFNLDYTWGYLLAFLGVIIWGFYSLYSKYKPSVPSDMVGIYCGMGALISLCLHLALEQTVVPTVEQTTLTLLKGLAGPALAYQLWDYGMKFGNATWLSVTSYFARIAALVLLVIYGYEPMSNHLVVSCILASVGVAITTIDIKLVLKPIKFLLDKLYVKRNVATFDTLVIEQEILNQEQQVNLNVIDPQDEVELAKIG